MLHRNYLKKTPSGPPHLVVDSHATGRILLQNFCDSIGEPFILQFRFLFALFFLNEKEKNGSRLVKEPTHNSQENQRILSEWFVKIYNFGTRSGCSCFLHSIGPISCHNITDRINLKVENPSKQTLMSWTDANESWMYRATLQQAGHLPCRRPTQVWSRASHMVP